MPVPVNDVSLQVILFLRTHFFCEKTNRHLLFLQKSFSTEALFRTHGDKKADVRFCFVHLSMNICFHRKRFTNLSSRFPDSQIFTAAAPSHAFRTMAFLQLTLPAYSDRIAWDFSPNSLLPSSQKKHSKSYSVVLSQTGISIPVNAGFVKEIAAFLQFIRFKQNPTICGYSHTTWNR